jgi:GTP pyrophosphokinase
MDEKYKRAAGLLCRTVSDGEQLANLEKKLDGDVYALTLGSAKVATISSTDKTISDAEHIRKMLFTMVNDIRVIFIKLADKLDMLRFLSMDAACRAARYSADKG